MSDVPVQVVVAAFKDENAASQALEQLKEAKKQGLIKIDNAAVLRKDADGKLYIKETADIGGGKGAVIGGVLGGVIGVLAGPIGWAVVGGAVVGCLVAKLHDGGFKDDRLKKLGEGLGPGNSAIVAVVEHTWVRDVERAMADAGAQAVTEELSADIARQLKDGGEVAYTVVATGDTMAAARMTTGDQKAAGDTKPAEGETKPAVGEAKPAEGEAKPAEGDTKAA